MKNEVKLTNEEKFLYERLMKVIRYELIVNFTSLLQSCNPKVWATFQTNLMVYRDLTIYPEIAIYMYESLLEWEVKQEEEMKLFKETYGLDMMNKSFDKIFSSETPNPLTSSKENVSEEDLGKLSDLFSALSKKETKEN